MHQCLEGIGEFVSSAAPVAIPENDGVLVVGSSVLDAFDRFEVLESIAEAVINAKTIGYLSPMSDEIIEELRSAFGLNGTQ